MQAQEDRRTAQVRCTRDKVRRAAKEITCGRGNNLDRLVAAWPYLRPLFSNTVPGQAGLTDAEKWELQGILTSMGGWKGAGANSLDIRRLPGWEAAKVADRIRRLAASLPPEPSGTITPVQVATVTSGRR